MCLLATQVVKPSHTHTNFEGELNLGAVKLAAGAQDTE